jgi:hypothetical protein
VGVSGLLNGAVTGDPGDAQERVAALMRKAAAPPSLFEACVAVADWVEAAHADFVDDGPGSYQRRLSRQQRLQDDLAGAEDEQRKAAVAYGYALYATRRPSRWGYAMTPLGAVVAKVVRRQMPWTVSEVGWLFHVAAGLKGNSRYCLIDLLSLPLAVTTRMPDAELPALANALQAAERALREAPGEGAGRTRALRRVTEQLERAQPDRQQGLPENILDDEDTFGAGARSALLQQFTPDAAGSALRVLSRYGTAVAPNRKWQTEAAAQVHDGDLLGICDLLLRRACGHRETEIERRAGRHAWTEQTFASPATATVLRAAAWVAAQHLTDTRLALVGDVAVHCGVGLGGSGGSSRCGQVTTTAVSALAAAATACPAQATDVVAQLARIRDRVQNKTIRKAVEKAIAAAADAAGLSPGQLLERAVPTLGLGPDGTGQVTVGDHTALLALSTGPAGAKLDISWRTPTGREVATVPAAVKEQDGDRLAELRATAAQAKKVAVTQRQRLEDLLAVGRTWPAPDWVSYYVGHPLVGVWARQFIWQTRPAPSQDDGPSEPGWSSGLPTVDPASGAWTLIDHDGTRTPVGEGDELRLWHPIRQPLSDVRAWRAHLTEAGLRQPFKQAFREIYLLTPAEETTGTYSNRFAAHIVRSPQLGALVRTRGWNAPHLGYWDGGHEATATKDVGEDGWRASFDYALVANDDDGYETPSLAATDQVRFERWAGPRTGGGWQPQPLTEVPALVFSEAMRDVDLFVGVTSIAADPTWSDRGTAGQRDYWHAASFGDLTESAQMRKDAIAALLPRTKLRDRARLEGNFLVVSGHLRDYKIHLGSTNILMSPADTYLCIVPSAGDTDPGVFLPFEEGGGKLSVIWSKAFLLAEDTAITAPSITHQLRAGLR